MQSLLTELARWLRLVFRWLAESPIAWSMILIVGAATAWVLVRPTEQSIRLVGTVLQVLGTTAVAYDIYGALREFDKPGYIQRFQAWAGRFPRWRPKLITGSANIVLSGDTMTASGHVSFVPDATSGVPERLAALEREMKAFRDRVDASGARVTQELVALRQEMAAESTAHTSSISALKDRLERLHVGSLDWAAAGVLLVLIGTILSGFSGELNAYFGR